MFEEGESLIDNLNSSGSSKKYQNIDFDIDKRWWFYILIGLIWGTSAVLVAMLLFFWSKCFDGYDWSDINKRFNFHPIMMVSGMVLFFGNSTILFRVFRYKKKWKVKLFHFLLHIMSLCCIAVGLYAVISTNIQLQYGNFYTLHSWLGLLTVAIFYLQLLFGFIVFYVPIFHDHFKSSYLHLHKFVGLVLIFLAIITAITGMNEYMIMSAGKVYKLLLGVTKLANMIGILLIIFGALVTCLLTVNSFERLPEKAKLFL